MRKKIFILITFTLIFGECCNNKKQPNSKNSEINTGSDFYKFISKFEQKKLPDSITNTKLPYVRFLITSDLDFLYNNVNFKKNKKSMIHTQYYGVYSYRFNNNAEAIVYSVISYAPYESQYIIATYSIEEKRIINTLVVFGTDETNYLIQSWINKEGQIKIMYIYDLINTHINQFEDFPEYRLIDVVDETYQILPNGKIVEIGKSLSKTYLAKKINERYVYPVEPPDNRKWSINPLRNIKIRIIESGR